MFDFSLLKSSINFRSLLLLLMVFDAKEIDTPERVNPGKPFLEGVRKE